MPPDPVQAVLAYHQLSTHRLPNRYARSLGYLDWDTQPDPFRRYVEADGRPVETVGLAREGFSPGPTLAAIYDPGRIAPAPVDARSLARLLFDSLALSAWKRSGAQRWSLRCNPSSGNLHPTEAYPITGAIPGAGGSLATTPGVWHYTPLVHALERRATLDPQQWADLIGDGEGVLVGLTSILWREAWKYGERAFRYCQHDVGHALASLAYAAAALGWQTRPLVDVDDPGLAGLLGLADDPLDPEQEHADLLVFVGPRVPSRAPALPATGAMAFEGLANRLSDAHHPWPVVAQVARQCVRVGPVARADADAADERPEPPDRGVPARASFRSRRSAVAMDGVTRLGREAWLEMLARTMPRPGQVPFASLPGPARVHLLLFVHRVEGVEPGLYLLTRDPARAEGVRAAIGRSFEWAAVDTELGLPLVRLERADARQAASVIACRQAIASDGAFAVAMLAELEPTLRERGAWSYRELHWEAGAIGQVLYLEAEAAGVRGTGIGCFFDTAIAELLGLRGAALACVYMFTVGGPVDDPRLETLPAYAELEAVPEPGPDPGPDSKPEPVPDPG